MTLSYAQRTLIVAGAVLFLLGLLEGAAVQSFANPRMALSAHLTAVQSGVALMIVGVVWSALSLAPRTGLAARWAIVIGMYGLWIGLTAAAATGASRDLPIAGAGHRADATVEQIVSAIVLGTSGLMTLGWIMFLAGLVRSSRVATPND